MKIIWIKFAPSWYIEVIVSIEQNMTTGSAKTKLSIKSIRVIFDLPKTFTTLVPLIATISEENGIWIDMQLDDNPFYMFITK